jgi:hypothetical protein
MDKMAAELFVGEDNSECDFLSNTLDNDLKALDEATSDKERARLLAEIRAVSARMKALHCEAD